MSDMNGIFNSPEAGGRGDDARISTAGRRSQLTGDASVRQFEVAAEVERTRLLLLGDERRHADVTLPASGAQRVEQVRDVRRTADDAVRRRHAPTLAHPTVPKGVVSCAIVARNQWRNNRAVSYTHLTLPTTYSV